MAIGRTFEESLQKAMRMVDPGINGFEPHSYDKTDADLVRDINVPSPSRIYVRTLVDTISLSLSLFVI